MSAGKSMSGGFSGREPCHMNTRRSNGSAESALAMAVNGTVLVFRSSMDSNDCIREIRESKPSKVAACMALRCSYDASQSINEKCLNSDQSIISGRIAIGLLETAKNHVSRVVF
jgi:hypothetical protein